MVDPIVVAANHTITLISPTIRVDADACLNVSFIAVVDLTVKLAYLNLGGSYAEKVVYRSVGSLGGEVTRLLQVNPYAMLRSEDNTSSSFDFVVVVTATVYNKDKMAVILQELQLTRTSCVRTRKYSL